MSATASTRYRFVVFLAALAAAPAGALPGADLRLAPPSFTHQGKRLVPVDFDRASLDLTFDVAAKRARGRSRITFYAGEAGYPILDLVPKPSAVRLNGAELGAAGLPEVSPDSSTTFRYVASPVQAESWNTLEIDYDFPTAEVTFSSTGVRMGFFMSDVGADRDFLEAYAPSNFEFDHYSLEITLSVKGARKRHRLFTNGRVEGKGENAWSVSFPSYYTTSSFYLHLTEQDLHVKSADYAGIAATFPVTVYASAASDAETGMERAKKTLAELEKDYGPFAHENLVLYVTPDGGGMEHCGAAITSLYSLEHELTHSWFARGYLPANGNAGWIDEAIATWRDNDYPSPAAAPERPPVNLAAHSPYRRTTPWESYDDGGQLIAELDHHFRATGGMKPPLRRWFEEKKYRVVTTAEFQAFLEHVTDTSIAAMFDRYVYGNGSRALALIPGFEGLDRPHWPTRHPRPLTAAERARIR